MTEEQILVKANEICKDKFIAKGIHNVNYSLGHPFTIGPKHVTHAANNCGGILGDATLKAVPCAHPGCKATHDAHTSDRVMFLQLLRTLTNKEASEVLFKLKTEFEAEGFAGFGFVDTPKKFRIEEPIN